jgi:hypothetical protein
MPLTTNTERRLIGDFRFTDNQLQRVMLEIRHAIHQLQGLNGAEGGTLTRAEIVQLINNLLVGIKVDVEEAPIDGTPYSRQDADWVGALQDAPSNGTEYVRKDGGWAVNTGGSGSGIRFTDARMLRGKLCQMCLLTLVILQIQEVYLEVVAYLKRRATALITYAKTAHGQALLTLAVTMVILLISQIFLLTSVT